MARLSVGGGFAGAMLGLLTGLLLGLSTSPVVGTVLAALTALLASVLGLAPDLAKFAGTPDANNRVAGFSIAMIVAVLIAVPVRTHGYLSPNPKAMMAELQAAGFTRDEAASLVGASLYGTAPSSAETAKPPSGGVRASVLFSDNVGPCTRLQQVAAQPVGRRLQELHGLGGDYDTAADRIEHGNPANQEALMNAFMTLTCG